MKKSELEAKILELEKKVAVLEARPICYGHYCGCNHYNYPVNPNYPWFPNPTIICGTTTGGLANNPQSNAGTVTFGKVNS